MSTLPGFDIIIRMQEVTRLLRALGQGEGASADALLPLVYEDLRSLANQRMSAEAPGQTLQPTALVHEAWLRISGEPHLWQNRAHFFAAAAEAMRRILVEKARRRLRVRHGAGLERIELDAIELQAPGRDEQFIAIDEALTRLDQESPRKAQVVKLRFFVGMTSQQAADALGLSLATVERDWAFAKVWLFNQIGP